jgi:hypothetical protein
MRSPRLGQRTTFIYDAGRPSGSINALGYRTTMIYDGVGQTLALIDAVLPWGDSYGIARPSGPFLLEPPGGTRPWIIERLPPRQPTPPSDITLSTGSFEPQSSPLGS